MDAQSRLVTIGEAARELCVSRGTVYNLINRGELKRANIGARAFITASSLESYRNSRAATEARLQRLASRSVPINEAQMQLGNISRGTIYNLLRSGELSGGQGYVTIKSLDAYLDRISR